MTVHNINIAPLGSPKNDVPQFNPGASSAPSTTHENTSAGSTETSRAAADARLKQDSLKQQSAGSRLPVPPESTLGGWLEALRFATNSSAFTQLEGARGAFTHIDHSKGEIWFDGGHRKINRDSPELDAIPGGKALFDNLMIIAKKLVPDSTFRRGDVFKIEELGHSTYTVDSNFIRQFIDDPKSNSMADDHVPATILNKTGEAETQHNLLAALKKQIEAPGAKPDLESIVVEIAPHSAFWRKDQPQPITMNLKQLMAAYGLQVPTTLEALANLERVLFTPPLSAPREGNYGGLLTKSVPLGEDAQKKIIETVSAWKALQTQVPLDAEGKAPSLFEYLKRAVPESSNALADTHPEAFLKALIDTPQARALGKQLQEAIGALPTATSGQEALLTALGLEANKSSAGLERDNLAGYNLRQPDNVGRTAAEIVKRFETHMAGIVGPEMAKVAAYQLLAMSAPEFLVTDVPESVTFGSPQWVMFSAEVYRREQSTPGSSAGQSYVQIRAQADLEPVTLEQESQTKAAALQAVVDWGLAKGIIKENSEGYSAETIASVTAALEEEANRMATALKGVLAPLPTRRDLALAALTQIYGEENAHLFEKKILTRPMGLNLKKDTLLNLFMSGELTASWSSTDSTLTTAVLHAGIKKLPDIKKEFVEKFDEYTDSFSKAAGEMFAYQVSQLPDEDLKRFEFGKMEMRHLSQPAGSNFPKDSESNALFQMFGSGAFLITTVLEGKKVEYIYSPQLGKIIKNGDPLPGVPEGWSVDSSRTAPFFSLNVAGKRYNLKPIWKYGGAEELPPPHILKPRNTPSPRVGVLAGQVSELYKKAVDDLKDAANGMSDSEKRRARTKMFKNFMLSLLPFHDLIKNIIEGDKHEAVVSGVFDFVGLFIPGAKGGFQGVKVGAKGVGSAVAFFKGAVKAGVKAANPVGAFYDSGSGLFKVCKTALNAAPPVNLSSFSSKLRIPGRSWDIPHGGYKQTIAEGTYQPLGENGAKVPVVAVKQGNNWYAFDHQTLEHYGPQLPGFTPIKVKELRDLRYDTGTSVKDGNDHAETAGEFQENASGPTPPQQPIQPKAAP